MIHATCHTADNVSCIEFDATPWFSEADAPSIVDLARRKWTQSRSSTDEDTNACTISLSTRQSDCNRNPWRTQPGKPSSVSSMDPRPSPGSKKTGPTLQQGSVKTREAQQRPQWTGVESGSGAPRLVEPPTRLRHASTRPMLTSGNHAAAQSQSAATPSLRLQKCGRRGRRTVKRPVSERASVT